MANPEQTDSEPLSRPGVESNVSAQDGSDKVYRPGAKGKGVILWVSLLLAVVAAVLAGSYLF